MNISKTYPWMIVGALGWGLCLISCSNEPKATATIPTDKDSTQQVRASLSSFGEQPISPQDRLVRRYSGSFDGQQVDLQLINWGDGFLSARLLDGKGKKMADLEGEMNLNEMVVLEMYEQDDLKGKLSFLYNDLNTIVGKWQKTGSQTASDFEWHATKPASDPPGNWSGNWYLNGIWDGGQLLIGDVRDTAFYFALSIFRNSHSGVIDGEAKIFGDSAVFHGLTDLAFEEDTCGLYFFLHKDHIQLDQRSTPSACGFGMRAFAGGRYDNKQIALQPTLTFGDSNAVFESAQQHDGFKTWIGEANYYLIADNMQVLEFSNYQNTKEGIKGKLTQGIVLGMFTTNEAIILHDSDKAFWAASLAPRADDPSAIEVRYFTNQTAWKNRLPKAFEDWRASFPDYPIVYELI